MITEIQIKNCASYDHTGVTLKDLKQVNFIYGPNASGKTTMANVIADVTKYPDCRIVWKNNRVLKSFVYNRNFIDDNFGRSKYQKGIFTLGKGEIDARETIDARKSEIEQTNTRIISDIAAIETNNRIREAMEVQFAEDCWKVYTPLKDLFKPAFKGCAHKITFKDRCKAEIHNSSDLLELAVLKEKAGRIYLGSTELLPDLALIHYSNLQTTEIHEIWGRRIIGKEDVDVAQLIKKLNNSDWVKQGLSHYSDSGELCPFCQQPTPLTLKAQLDEYFDETYLAQISLLQNLGTIYSDQTKELILEIEGLLSANNALLDLGRMEELMNVLVLKIKANKAQIEGKRKEPGRVIALETLQPELDGFNELIQQGRDQIELHNHTVKNLARESAQLTGEVWRYITAQLKEVHQRYHVNSAGYVKNIETLEQSISEGEDSIKKLRTEIAQLQLLGTNTEQTKNEINALLNKFGFTGFQLAEAPEESGSYQMVRLNGQRVERTLSEGEKTVVTFLYFYHLLKGSVEKDSIETDRVVVIDDPVSSLDGNALFMISHLVRTLLEEIRQGKSPIRQIILLTHHVSFFKEVSSQNGKGSEGFNDQTFWILRKQDGFSEITQYDENPVSTAYELLWREVRENTDSMTLNITLRRIIEHYLEAFGKISPDELLLQLEGDDQRIAHSLLVWPAAVEEEQPGNSYVPIDRERYLKVFRDIFEKTEHLEHYEKMMQR